MSVRNRSSYSSRQAERSGAWGLLRGAGILLLLAILSFALGFFVLARIMPGDNTTQAPNNSAPTSSTGNNGGTSSRSNVPSSTSPGVANASPAPQENRPGPSIDPEDDPAVQQPDSLDEPHEGTAGDTNHEEQPTSDNPQETRTPNPPDAGTPDSNRSMEEASHRSRERDAVQTPSAIDRTQSPRTPSSHATTRERDSAATAPETNNTANNGLFRVQVGAYSTREAAEKEAQRLTGQGFSANVQAMTSGGRTLYRVQHGAFRNKANAEAARERLKAAGVDSTLSQTE